MRVGIRVDASTQMGTGHLRRCLSLAQAMRDTGAQIRFVTRDLGVDSANQIAQQDFDDVAVLAPDSGEPERDSTIAHAAWAEVSQQRDIDQTVDKLQKFNPDWVVVDSYSFDARWHDAVRERLSCRIAQIDDLADRTIAPDLLIDHNYAGDHRAKYDDRLTREAKILGGPRYALLGPCFADAERYAFSEAVESIGVFMGGIDAGNHSGTVLDALDALGFDGAVEIVATSANPHLDRLRARADARPQTKVSVDLPNLAAFFARHDIQVGAGGGASWERCCIGVPTILVVIAANQEAVAPQLARDGIVALAADPGREAIARQLASLLANVDKRQELAARSRYLVDGSGARRVADKMASEMQCDR